MRAVGQSLAVFALLVALAVLLTWPLAVRLDSAVTDLGERDQPRHRPLTCK